jgi:hypothetical protein
MSTAQDYVNQAHIVNNTVPKRVRPVSISHAWQLKRQVTQAQNQLSQVRKQVRDEIRQLNPKVAAVGTSKQHGGAKGNTLYTNTEQLEAFRQAKKTINDMLLQTWEIKFDLEDYIRNERAKRE